MGTEENNFFTSDSIKSTSSAVTATREHNSKKRRFPPQLVASNFILRKSRRLHRPRQNYQCLHCHSTFYCSQSGVLDKRVKAIKLYKCLARQKKSLKLSM